MSYTTPEKAKDEIAHALEKQTASAPFRPAHTQQVSVEPEEAPRLPVRVQKRDLEAAIDEMIDRFPKTLEYLAK